MVNFSYELYRLSPNNPSTWLKLYNEGSKLSTAIIRVNSELRKNGVTIVDSIETDEYGKFVHILDPENNKIELWEPVDSIFTKMYEGKTTK